MNIHDHLRHAVEESIADMCFGRDGVAWSTDRDTPEVVRHALATGAVTREEVVLLVQERFVQHGVWCALDILESPPAYPYPETVYGWPYVVGAYEFHGLPDPERLALERQIAGRTTFSAYATQARTLFERVVSFVMEGTHEAPLPHA